MRRFKRAILHVIQGEHGQYAVWFLIMLPLILALIGLVVDGGNMYRWYRRAQIAADTAAQAAAHEVDAAHFAATNQVILEPDAASVAAYYAGLNSGGRVHVTQVAVMPDNRVRVIARCSVPTIFMRAVGIEQSNVSVVGYARPAFGLNVEGQ
jgi:Flp pilus assembly protein TadG